MRLYLAGPMTGIPQFNFPAFELWAVRLRCVGFAVVSPHEQDDAAVQAAAWASPDGDLTGLPAGMEGSDPVLTAIKNVRDIAACDGIALIDDWYKSSGTIHEIASATRFRLPVAPVQLWERLGAVIAAEALA